MKNEFLYLGTGFVVSLIIFFSGCSTPQRTAPEQVENGQNLSYTGSEIIRGEIMNSFDSIKRIQNSVIYRTYLFDLDGLPTRSFLESANLENYAVESFTESHSTAGTALVLSNRMNRSTLLTAAHVVTFADTIWHKSEVSDRIEAVSVVESVSHYLVADDGIHALELAVDDQRRDLALMMLRWGDEGNPRLTPLSVPAGNPENLEWTDLVYALGYPRGFQMVTRGMVSKFTTIPRRSFVLDAPFNRGFSGGVLFTVRGDGSGLDWVGILSAAYAETEYLVSPGEIDEEDFNPNVEYRGPLYLRRERRINYGISYAVGMEEIGGFFNENSEQIRRLGLTVPDVP